MCWQDKRTNDKLLNGKATEFFMQISPTRPSDRKVDEFESRIIIFQDTYEPLICEA